MLLEILETYHGECGPVIKTVGSELRGLTRVGQRAMLRIFADLIQ